MNCRPLLVQVQAGSGYIQNMYFLHPFSFLTEPKFLFSFFLFYMHDNGDWSRAIMVVPMLRGHAESLLIGFWEKIPPSKRATRKRRALFRLSIIYMTPRNAAAALKHPQEEKVHPQVERHWQESHREEDQSPEHMPHATRSYV